MLAEFIVANFRSFAEEQSLSLIASPDRAHADHIYRTSSGDKILKSAAIYGKNASGKSNLVAAMRVMRQFVESSASKLNIGDPIPGIAPFRLDPSFSGEPSKFTIKIVLDGTHYEYGFWASSECVTKEWLRKDDNVVFERASQDAAASCTFCREMASEGPLIAKQTRNNALVLSVGAQQNNGLLATVYRWFKDKFWVFDMSEHPMPLVLRTATQARGDDQLRAKLLDMMSDADFGIAGISFRDKPTGDVVAEMPPEIKELFTAAALKKLAGTMQQLSIATVHHAVLGMDKSVEFNFLEDESKGTQRVFAIGGPLVDAIKNAALVVVDEFDCSLHPKLSRGLIKYFQQASGPDSGAQLVLATHDSSLFSEELFRRDELWIVDKFAAGRSMICSLHDFEGGPPRSSTAFEKNYLRGSFGGVPILGPLSTIQPQDD